MLEYIVIYVIIGILWGDTIIKLYYKNNINKFKLIIIFLINVILFPLSMLLELISEQFGRLNYYSYICNQQ